VSLPQSGSHCSNKGKTGYVARARALTVLRAVNASSKYIFLEKKSCEHICSEEGLVRYDYVLCKEGETRGRTTWF
jgi:hypothetical protein